MRNPVTDYTQQDGQYDERTDRRTEKLVPKIGLAARNAGKNAKF